MHSSVCGSCWARLTPNQLEKFRDVTVERVVERVEVERHDHTTIVPNVSRRAALLLGFAGGVLGAALTLAARAVLKL